MKTVIFRLIRRSLLACILLILQSLPVHASNPTLTFELSWNGKATDKVTIKETLTRAQTFITDSGEVDFRFFQGQVSPDIYHNLVGEVTANNEYGTSLPYRKVETEQGGASWLISLGNSNEIIVSYEINYKYKGGNIGYRGSVLDRFLCGTLEATFLVPSLPLTFPFMCL
jgi:hypothetical protein